MTTSIQSCTITKATATSAVITVTSFHSPPILSWDLYVSTTYKVSSTGRITISAHILPVGPKPSSLPRLGYEFTVPENITRAKWFGRGPSESYKDKKASQRVGIYSAGISDLHTPYEVFQENGNRTETRWVGFLSSTTTGFTARTVDGKERRLFDFAVSRYSAQELERAGHPSELVDGGGRCMLRWMLIIMVWGRGVVGRGCCRIVG